jgi:hypothetical protein
VILFVLKPAKEVKTLAIVIALVFVLTMLVAKTK